MLTIYVSPKNRPMHTTDGYKMSVKIVCVYQQNKLVELRDYKPASTIEDVQIIFMWKFIKKRLNLTPSLKKAILNFLHQYQIKPDYSYDCFSFVNTVKELPSHKVNSWYKYWDTKPLPVRKSKSSVIFILNHDGSYFHHAAIYIGFGLYLSVYGAGGDLEIATLKSMVDGYDAKKVILAIPK